MSYEYRYAYDVGWAKTLASSDPLPMYIAAPNWGKWVRIEDEPSEFRLISAGNLEIPTSWSIKRDTVGDIYRNHPYISQDARVRNRQGIRLSFAYKEAGRVIDVDSTTDPDYFILPLSLTVNCTLPVVQALDDGARNNFLSRALGAFMGVSESDTGRIDAYADFTLRWAGDLRPHHYSGILG